MPQKPPKPEGYYDHQPLPLGSIRIMQINEVAQPSHQTWHNLEEDLHISLHHYPLSSCPNFVALSYTWGEPSCTLDDENPQIFTQVERCYPVMCDGKIILGTRNLRSALRYLRLKSLALAGYKNGHSYFMNSNTKDKIDYFGATKLFWIDAVCIDQDDVSEKQHQIPLMGRIYSKAESCLVWLGEADKWSVPAITFLGKIGTTEGLIEGYDSLEMSTRAKVKMRFQQIFNDAPESLILATQMFFSRSWFSRVWTLQEVFLPVKVSAFCGTMHLSFGVLTMGCAITYDGSGFLQRISKIPKFKSITAHERKLSIRYQDICEQNIRMLRDPYHIQGRSGFPVGGDDKIDFSPARLLSAGRRATMLHDHIIYGVLCMTEEFQAEPRAGQKPLSVDYSKPINEVYTTATAFLLRQRNDLFILHMAQDPETKLKARLERSNASTDTAAGSELLPSWCPDYSINNSATFDRIVSWPEELMPPSPWGSRNTNFNTGDDKVLFANGICYDSINHIGNPNDLVFGPDPLMCQSSTQYILQLLEFVISTELDAPVLSNGLSISRAQMLWRIMSGDTFYSQTPAPPVIGLFFNIFLAHAFHLSRNDPTPQDDGEFALDPNLSRYIQLIDRLLGLEPASRPFLPDTSKLRQAFHNIPRSCTSMGQRQAVFMSVCALESIQDLMARAQETGLTSEVVSLVGAKPSHDSISKVLYVEFSRSIHLRNCIGSRTRRVCLGPNPTRCNVEIWMLHGLILPAVLRPLKDEPGSFEFIGNADVLGIETDIASMDEEFVSRETRTICIK